MVVEVVVEVEEEEVVVVVVVMVVLVVLLVVVVLLLLKLVLALTPTTAVVLPEGVVTVVAVALLLQVAAWLLEAQKLRGPALRLRANVGSSGRGAEQGWRIARPRQWSGRRRHPNERRRSGGCRPTRQQVRVRRS